jgi:hypothetical protein
MTRDEIISMAREAGARVFGGKIVIADNASSGDGSDFVPRFAALVAARERETVLNEVLRGLRSERDTDQLRAIFAEVEAIRARAEKETK